MSYSGTKLVNIPQRKILPANVIVALSVAIIMATVAIFIYQDKASYKENLDNGVKHAERLIHMLADHVNFSLLSVELTLQHAIDRQYFNLLFGGNLHQDMASNFNTWLNETPHISSLIMVGRDGKVQLVAKKKSYFLNIREGDNIEQQSFFMHHKQSTDTLLLLSTLKTVIPGQQDQLIMSQSVVHVDGSFAGIVLAVIDKSFLMNFFRSVELNKNNQIAFMLRDQLIFALRDGKKDINLLKNSIVNFPMKRNAHFGIGTLEEKLDNPYKVLAYKTLHHGPVTIWLAVRADDIFSTLYINRLKYFGYGFVVILFICFVTGFIIVMIRQMAFVHQSEKTAILASQAKSDFLAKMSHELRTPLNAIIGFSEMMNSGYFGDLNDKQQERIRDINLCGNHLLELINDILEFSKGEAGKLTLQEEHIDIGQIIHKSLRIISPRAKSESIKIIDDSRNYLPLMNIDARKVQQILLNLLSNAVKFTPAGGSVTVHTERDSNGSFILSIQDTGIGIAAENINKALSVFGQVHSGHSHEGTGLGLPLCKMFAELHGGKLRLESKENQGTCVSLILPGHRVIQHAALSVALDEDTDDEQDQPLATAM